MGRTFWWVRYQSNLHATEIEKESSDLLSSNNVRQSSRKGVWIGSTYLADLKTKLDLFVEILQDSSLTDEEKQQRMSDLSRIDFNEIDKEKSQVGRLIKRYIRFALQLHQRIEQKQAEYADVKVFNYQRLFAEIEPMVLVNTIASVLEATSSTLHGPKDALPPLRSKVVRELGERAVQLAGYKVVTGGGSPGRAGVGNHQQEARSFGRKSVTSGLERQIGLLLFHFCEEWKLVKTLNNDELGVPPTKPGVTGRRLYAKIEPLPLPPQQMTNLFPRMLPPLDWESVEKEQIPFNPECNNKRGTPSSEGTFSREGSFSTNIDGRAPIEVLCFPSPIRGGREHLCISKSEDFQLYPSDEHLLIINRLQRVAMRVDDRLLDYIHGQEERLAEIGLLQPISLTARNITDEIKELKKGLRGLSGEGSKELEKEIKRTIWRLRSKHEGACSQFDSQRKTIGVATTMRGRPLYLTAFHDFRGRLYRGSILSPQSSSLARALMFFDHTALVDCSNASLFASHIGFSFKKFVTFAESSQWVAENIVQIIAINRELCYIEDGKRIDLASVEDPWRAISFSLLLKEHLISTGIEREEEKPIKSFILRRKGMTLVLISELRSSAFSIGEARFHSFRTGMPFNGDATASAFQIVGLLSRDAPMCRACNIIPPLPGEKAYRRDMYMEIARLVTASNPSSEFSRGEIKQVFMPKSYGLTGYGMFSAIREACPNATKEEVMKRKNILDTGWLEHCGSSDTIFKLISSLGKMQASSNIPLTISIHPRWRSVQQYRKYIIHKSRVNVEKRGTPLGSGGRREKTVNLLIVDRGKGHVAKSGNSAAANVIHSIDGLICTEVAQLLFQVHPEAPLSTNHDCFYTTLDHIPKICSLYNKAVVEVMSADIINKITLSAVANAIRASKIAEAARKTRNNEILDVVLLLDCVGNGTSLADNVTEDAQEGALDRTVDRVLDRLDRWIKLPSREALSAVLDLFSLILSKLSKNKLLKNPKLPKHVQETIRLYMEYRQMIAGREDLLPHVVGSKFSLFP